MLIRVYEADDDDFDSHDGLDVGADMGNGSGTGVDGSMDVWRRS